MVDLSWEGESIGRRIGLLAQLGIFVLVVIASDQVERNIGRCCFQQFRAADEAFHALLPPNLADVEEAGGRALNVRRAACRVEELIIVSRAHNAHALLGYAVHLRNLALLRFVQREDAVECAHAFDDELAFERVLSHLAQIGAVADAAHVRAREPPRLGNLAHTVHGDAARQIQVVAEHHVGELLLACFANRLVESAFEPLAHLGRHVAIACRLVWHLVAHAAYGEG